MKVDLEAILVIPLRMDQLGSNVSGILTLTEVSGQSLITHLVLSWVENVDTFSLLPGHDPDHRMMNQTQTMIHSTRTHLMPQVQRLR